MKLASKCVKQLAVVPERQSHATVKKLGFRSVKPPSVSVTKKRIPNFRDVAGAPEFPWPPSPLCSTRLIASASLLLAMIPFGSKMLGCWRISLDDVAHAFLADSSAAPGRSHGEIPSKSAPREFGPASPTPGADPKCQPTAFEASGPCFLGMALPHLKKMADWPSTRAG
jgi:hypothetical protein